MNRVKINVSGTHFEFNSKILEKRKYGRLTQMCAEAERSGHPLEFIVDRPSDCFAAILSFYQTDELHMPATICPKAFRKELSYWNVAETNLEKCCLYRYYSFCDDFDTHEQFRKETFMQDLRDGVYIPVNTDNRLNRTRRRIWKIIDYKENTAYAKVYLIMVFLMVILCIVTLALSTVPEFQRKLSKCELLEYMEHAEHEAAETARTRLGNPDCSSFQFKDLDVLNDDDMYWEEYEYADNGTKLSSTVILPRKTVRYFVFVVLERIAAAFFTLDLLLRLFTCPSLPMYFRSILNTFDMLAVAGFYVHLIVIQIEKEHKYETGWIQLINYLQIFRIMRLFRFVRNVRASRVLIFSLRQNARDMTLLVLLVMIAVSTSASLIYFIEDREAISSIPVAWYWAMITLTTVGYGDIAPKSGAGRILAAILAICGVLLLSITLPMFVNNFLTLYQYSCLDESIEKRTKSTRKLKGAINVVSALHINEDRTGNSEHTAEKHSTIPGTNHTMPNDSNQTNNNNDMYTVDTVQ